MDEPTHVIRSQVLSALHAAIGADAQGILHVLRDLDDEVSSLRVALTSNRRIGIAVGIVMLQMNLEDGPAFEALRQVSMNTNCKVHTVAEQVIRDRRLSQ